MTKDFFLIFIHILYMSKYFALLLQLLHNKTNKTAT